MRPLTLKGKGLVLDYVTPRDGHHHARIAGSYAMSLDLANAIHRQIYMGCFANAMTRWAKGLLHSGGSFLDVGAHAGYFSLIAADRVGCDGRVIAVEPNPVAFAMLQAHVAANAIAHVEACRWGLSERDGSLPLYVPRADSYRDYNATLLRRPEWTAVEIPVRRLDDCLDLWRVERIDLMKIDVEGAEPRVLAGGADHLSQGVIRHVMIEINGPRLVEAGSSPTALVDQLGMLGFEPARLSRGRAVRVAHTDVDLDPGCEWDGLFVHTTTLRSAS
jgi:FkbM family methyltransferase